MCKMHIKQILKMFNIDDKSEPKSRFVGTISML